MSIKTFHKKLILSFLTPILFFGFLELALRMFHVEVNTGEGPIQKKVSFFNFRLIDGKKKPIDRDRYIETGPKVAPIDSNSYRCSYTKYNKQLNEYRIITLGDSSTYGAGVESEESFPFLLENNLNSSDIKKEFKIFNFGYPGYSSLQGLLFLKKYIAQLKPDCVIVWFGANDRCFAPFYSDKEFYTRNNKNLKITKIHNFLYNNLKFYRLVRNINLNYFRKIVDKSFNNPAERNYTKIRVSRSDFLKNLQEIKEMCLKNNSRVIFIEYCWYINDNLNRYERNNPIKPYIKLYDVYQAGEDKIHNYFLDQVHPSKLGHQLIAQKLSKEIEQLILRK